MAGMRHLIAVAVVVAGVICPVYAQRGGGGHGGGASRGGSFASHAGGFASHGGNFAVHSGGIMSRGATPFRGVIPSIGRTPLMGVPPSGRSPYTFSSERRPTLGPERRYPGRSGYPERGYGYRRAYTPAYAYGYGFPSGFTIWPGALLDSGLEDSEFYDNSGYDYGDAGYQYPAYDYQGPGYGYDGQGYYGTGPAGPPDSTATAEYGAPQNPAPSEEQAQAEPPDTYRAAYQRPPAAPEPDNTVTLVFKDGRPSEQIHNYMLTRTTLYVQDEHHQEIPVDELDLAATQKANRDSGVDFQLPGSSR